MSNGAWPTPRQESALPWVQQEHAYLCPGAGGHYFLGTPPLWGGSARQSSFFALSKVLPLRVPALAPLGAVGAPGMFITASPVRPAKTWAPKETLLYLLGLPPGSFPPRPSWGHPRQHAGGPPGEPEGPKARRSFAQMLSLWKCRVSSQAPCGGLGQIHRPPPSRWATQASGLLPCD